MGTTTLSRSSTPAAASNGLRSRKPPRLSPMGRRRPALLVAGLGVGGGGGGRGCVGGVVRRGEALRARRHSVGAGGSKTSKVVNLCSCASTYVLIPASLGLSQTHPNRRAHGPSAF